jgi:predicted helicase
MTLLEYINAINERYALGNTSEHTFRGDLQRLLEGYCSGYSVTNEPKKQKFGAPDYVITKKDISIGYLEAKDLDKNLNNKAYQEQFNHYKDVLDNLIITNYICFQLFQDKYLIYEVNIGVMDNNIVKPLSKNFDQFETLIQSFCSFFGQTIKNPNKLAEIMAGKARLLANVIENSIINDDIDTPSSLYKEMLAVQSFLIHDITPKRFADIYSQTITYGLFAARLHDPVLKTFSRQEAAELIPKSNPFLKRLFAHIASPDIDERIKWIVDHLTEVFLACDVSKILTKYTTATHIEDPILHFYEDFLSKYDPKLRKAKGVWYTPAPVVTFMVKAVDDLLIDEFNLPMGLADHSKTTIKVDSQMPDKRSKTGYRQLSQEVHKLQILDPATGTGTFLTEIIKQIHKKFKGQEGIWSNYVEKQLIPRLNGFELLMASYAIAHLKIDLLLKETGFKSKTNQRTKIYLTNSLEEAHPDTGTLFAGWLSSESNEANYIKRNTPVMCMIGNPPYSGISSNNGPWITKLLEDYKYVNGIHFNEKKHWLNDDYVKFIRYGQYLIEKTKEGVLAFINPHGFTDNPTFRGMRWSLMKVFDKIYIIDLHGNAMKNEVPPPGMQNKNVFDIQQGVSINIFIKKKGSLSNKVHADIYHCDIWGNRNEKYSILSSNTIKSLNFTRITPVAPFYFFNQIDFSGFQKYNEGFALNELFIECVTGIVTARDAFAIDIKKEDLLKRIKSFCDPEQSNDETRIKFFGTKSKGKYPPGDSRGWKMDKARKLIMNHDYAEFIKEINYRPFDIRYIYYSSQVIDWGREKIVPHTFHDNLVIVFPRQAVTNNWSHIQVSKYMVDGRYHYSNKGITAFAPLYLYNQSSQSSSVINDKPQINFNMDIVERIELSVDLQFTSEDLESISQKTIMTPNRFSPVDLIDYIYAVLHHKIYREKNIEYLKVDFPKIPYPKDQSTFWNLVKLGGELRQIHLFESTKLANNFISSYPKEGSNTITRKIVKKDWQLIDIENEIGRIYINDEQYFDQIPLRAWEFYIGGYQPAQKWLKDRKTKTLDYVDIIHYHKMITVVCETYKLMDLIQKIELK